MNTFLHILQHTLGLDHYGCGIVHRNHFVVGPDSKDWVLCQSAVRLGLMEHRGTREWLGGQSVFAVTTRGLAYVQHHSPKPPKLTRSQQRYRAYLAADSNMKFGDWLRHHD